ncbi:peptide-methionine (S)-S-oxide reductase MsrA [Paracidovorax sp. MALMAid1276]|uniref:peptide-methionine (S)-S-oxide reductase MsrA n=1 Tax=Paracidovorax sp. MALMAid1276 TaxID=3411631 RepID=UPI003B9D650B
MLAALLYAGATSGARPSVALPPPDTDVAHPVAAGPATAVFAGGCFWGVQAVFQHTQGVLNAVSGYAGGTPETATYSHVSAGRTNHAEAVAITFDPQVVSYGQLLQIFFSVAHDPTEVDRQGPDVGRQYRSAIFYAQPQEQRVAQQYIAQLDASQLLPRKIATTLAPLDRFYPAEDEHQDYATRNPHSLYIATYDRPKITQLQTLLPELFRASPVLVSGQAVQ